MTNDLDSLIDCLQAIQIQQTELFKEQARIVDRIVAARSTGRSSPVTVPSNLQQTAVELQRGDRVFITNITTHGSSNRHHAAVVTAAYSNRIELKTYSGHFTWRKPKNLRRLKPSEHSALSNDPF